MRQFRFRVSNASYGVPLYAVHEPVRYGDFVLNGADVFAEYATPLPVAGI